MGPPPPMRPELEAAALGLIQGATELLPVSSSAHVAMVPWLLGWEVAAWPPDRRKELEVALHTGTAAALAGPLWRGRPGARAPLLSLAPPAPPGFALAGWVARPARGAGAVPGGARPGGGAPAGGGPP